MGSVGKLRLIGRSSRHRSNLERRLFTHHHTPLQKLHRHHHHRNRKSHTPASPLRLKLNSILFIIILFNTLACLKLIISRVDAGCDIAHYPGPFGLQPFRHASIWISARLTTTITDTAPFSSSIHLVLPLSLVVHVFPLYTHSVSVYNQLRSSIPTSEHIICVGSISIHTHTYTTHEYRIFITRHCRNADIGNSSLLTPLSAVNSLPSATKSLQSRSLAAKTSPLERRSTLTRRHPSFVTPHSRSCRGSLVIILSHP